MALSAYFDCGARDDDGGKVDDGGHEDRGRVERHVHRTVVFQVLEIYTFFHDLRLVLLYGSLLL